MLIILYDNSLFGIYRDERPALCGWLGEGVWATLEEQPRLTDLWVEEALSGVSEAPPISTVRLPV